ncbi:hypothetical protein CYJ37_23565 [Bacillus sp. UMB0728]|nr:ParM/StbA family protein [Bacillus sp. UMB0728]PLR70515.1 hypothetical protein CYJ37_23565 [Bacillus sp. UMB0728]
MAMKEETIRLEVVNDNGNSEHAIGINGELIRQPNVYAQPTEQEWLDDVSDSSLVPGLLKGIDVSIQTPSITFPGRYYVGLKAMDSKFEATPMDVKYEKKYESDLPIINTLGTIAAKAVQINFDKTEALPEELDVKVNMITALPIQQWDQSSAELFANRFKDHLHSVTVHVGHTNVLVKIKFELVKVAPEGVPAIFSIIYNPNGKIREDLFSEFEKEYGLSITGKVLLDKRVSHIDIGDGTTDFPVTVGFNLDKRAVEGCTNGVGHAIEAAMKNFLKAPKYSMLTKITRNKYSEWLKDENHENHQDAVKYMREATRVQAQFIFNNYKKVLGAIDNEIDYIVVYGGGSIVMKDILYPLLKKLVDTLDKKLIWIPEENAPLMNVDGLQIVLNNMTKKKKQAAVKA